MRTRRIYAATLLIGIFWLHAPAGFAAEPEAPPAAVSGSGDPALVLDNTTLWRQYEVLGILRFDPAALKAEGEALLSEGVVKRMEKESKRLLQQRNIDWSKIDWRDYACDTWASQGGDYTQVMAYLPETHPAGGWLEPDFDDGAWARQRITPPQDARAGGGVHYQDHPRAIYLRTYFAVPDPSKAGDLVLDAAYRGGIRVLLNGKEVVRRNLPEGPLGPEVHGEGYSKDAYLAALDEIPDPQRGTRCVGDLRFPYQNAPRNDNDLPNFRTVRRSGPLNQKGWDRLMKLRDRELAGLKISNSFLRKGRNVLAVEIRGSLLHPITCEGAGGNRFFPYNWWTNDVAGNHTWSHGKLLRLALREPGGAVPSVFAENSSPGTQVWIEDMHARLYNTARKPPEEPERPLRFVGALNGKFSALLAVRAGRKLAGLNVKFQELKLVERASPPVGSQETGGTPVPPATIPAGAWEVGFMQGYLLKELQYLGCGRGLERGAMNGYSEAAIFDAHSRDESLFKPGRRSTGQKLLDALETTRFYDHIHPAANADVAAGAVQPIWINLRIPANAETGRYTGRLTVSADGMDPVEVPIEASVAAWRLPNPLDFQTVMTLEESPYGIATKYKVPLWSDEHFRLIAASFRQLARVGNDLLMIPVIHNTEFGNRTDSMIKWTRKADGRLAFDYGILDRYLDAAVRELGPPRCISFTIMHWMHNSGSPMVTIHDEKSGKDDAVDVGWSAQAADRFALWREFGTALIAHMKEKGLERSIYWGHSGDLEADQALIGFMHDLFPTVYWSASPHSYVGGSGGGGHSIAVFRYVSEVRQGQNSANGGTVYTLESQKGWKRPDGTYLNTHCPRGTMDGMTLPSNFRCVDKFIQSGLQGIGRSGFDYYDFTWNDGFKGGGDNNPPGQPCFMLAWPGKDGAEPSARYEALIEGVQEAEVRIFLEQTLERGILDEALAAETKSVLRSHNLDAMLSFSGWQQRSALYFETAAKVAAKAGGDAFPREITTRVPALGENTVRVRLRNWSGAPREWTATPGAGWIVPAKTGATLSGQEDLVIRLDGKGLKPGEMLRGALTVTDKATGTACSVNLSVTVDPPLDFLADSTRFNVEAGKPDTRVFRLANKTIASQDWNLSSDVPWQTINPSTGTLRPGESAVVNITAAPEVSGGAASFAGKLKLQGAGGVADRTIETITYVIPAYKAGAKLPFGHVVKIEDMDRKRLKSHKLMAAGDELLLGGGYALVADNIRKSSNPVFGWKSENITLVIGTKKFDRALWVYPRHQTVYDLAGSGHKAFAAYVGVPAAAAKELIRHHERRASFEIWVDGKLAAQSGLMTPFDEARLLTIEGLETAKEFKLVTRLDSDADNWNYMCVWADACFYK